MPFNSYKGNSRREKKKERKRNEDSGKMCTNCVTQSGNEKGHLSNEPRFQTIARSSRDAPSRLERERV